MIPQPVYGGEGAREAGFRPPQAPGGRWRHFCSLFRSYWFSEDWKFAWFALALLITYEFGAAYLMVFTNRWQQAFFDGLAARNAALFFSLVLTYIGIMATQLGATVFHQYFSATLGIRWRALLTRKYLDRWMARDRFTEIERLRMIDNPDQRISEDIRNLTGATAEGGGGSGVLGYVLGIIGSVVASISMIFILLETAPPIDFTIAGHSISIPGSTVWYAILYVILGSIATVYIGKPFIRAQMRLQHREADFRAGMVQTRRNASQISLAGAVATERLSLGQAFQQIRQTYRSYIWSSIGLDLGVSFYQRIGEFIPLLLLVPRFFANVISFGQMMAARDAFSSLTSSLSFFIQSYNRIGQFVASLNRLKALDDAIDAERPRGIGFSACSRDGGTALQTDGLRVFRPTGQPLLEIGDWTVGKGERWLVRGPSGTGKSTLLRALVGLWPDGAGSVTLDDRGKIMVVPQRLYLPLGTLKGAVCFPDLDGDHADSEVIDLLEQFGLGEHVRNLHEPRFWQDELSPGEQQRAAIVRILLQRPDVLILDEATSALDFDGAQHFYRTLRTDLPDITLVSVAHTETLDIFHTHELTLRDGKSVARSLSQDRIA